MNKEKLAHPGSFVICKNSVIEGLILWSSPYGSVYDDVDTVKSTDLLLVIKSRRSRRSKTRTELLTEEWNDGCYLVLAPSGIKGWVGAGWVKQI